MSDGLQRINLAMPYWAGYGALLQRLAGEPFPTAARLNALLPEQVLTATGHAVRFVSAESLGAVDYEAHIHHTGEVSTRAGSWHDLFNALAWCRWPRLKAAMNEMHHRFRDSGVSGGRGPQRDALTLFDESGVIVLGTSRAALEALAGRDWQRAFQTNAAAWDQQLSVVICGHALMEKFLAPYKAMTAHAVFVALDEGRRKHLEASLVRHAYPRADQPGQADQGFDLLVELDRWLGQRLVAGRLFTSPAALSPLPLMGIPGWWRAGPQDTAFYADRTVFRPPPPEVSAVLPDVLIHSFGAET